MQRHGFKAHYVGLVDGNQTIIAALILYRHIIRGLKYAYTPRGFIIDYNDTALLKLFTMKLKRLLWKQGFVFIKIDPFIVYQKLSPTGEVIDAPNTTIINALKKLGYVHCGLNKYFEALKPRTNAILTWYKTPEELFKTLSKKTQANIRKAISKGITIHKGDRNEIEILYNMIKNKVPRRKLNYYFDYYDIYKEKNMIDIYYAKLNPAILLQNARDLYDNESAHNNALVEAIQKNNDDNLIDKKIKSDELLNIYKKNVLEATQLFNQYPEGLIIATSLVINYNQSVYFLLDGYNPKFKKLNASHLLKWLIIAEYIEKGYHHINLNGISCNLEPKSKYDGLNQFKLRFGSTATELIGEFDLPLNGLIYFFFNKIKILNKMLLKTIKKVN